METMKYVKTKEEIGLGLIKFTQMARVSLVRVLLEFDGGWWMAVC